MIKFPIIANGIILSKCRPSTALQRNELHLLRIEMTKVFRERNTKRITISAKIIQHKLDFFVELTNKLGLRGIALKRDG